MKYLIDELHELQWKLNEWMNWLVNASLFETMNQSTSQPIINQLIHELID